jgi:hypothetical protein
MSNPNNPNKQKPDATAGDGNRGRGAYANHKISNSTVQYVNQISPGFGFGAMNRICPECGCGFDWLQDGPGRPPVYCSNRCRHEARRRTIRESTRRWRRKEKE